jgi:translation initiation factor 2 subunit 1
MSNTSRTDEAFSFPEVGEIVLATVRQITPHGIYVDLDEYNGINGFLHVSEISTGWVRNIEKVAKPQQKLVLKVIRAEKSRREIDLSLRQVVNEERRTKLIEWKKKEKAVTIMSMVKKKLNLDDKLYNDYVSNLLDKFGSLYDALEAGAKRQEKAYANLEIPAPVTTEIIQQAKEKIIPPRYEVGAIVEVTSRIPDGVQEIKKALISASRASSVGEITITYVGAPKYRLRVVADDYKQADKVMEAVIEKVKDGIGKHGTFNFKREMSRKYGGAA